MRRSSVLLLLSAVALSASVNAHPYSKIPDSYQLAEGFTSEKSSSSASSSNFNHANQQSIEINGLHNGQAFSGSKVSGYSSNGGSHSNGHAYSSASVSGAVPIGLIQTLASSAAVANSGAQNGAIIPHVEYGVPQKPGTGFLNLQHDASATKINSAAAGTDQSAEKVGSGQFQGFGVSGSASSPQQAEHGAQAGHVAGVQYWWMVNGQKSPFVQNGSPSSGCKSNGCSPGGTVQFNNNEIAKIKFQGNPFLHQSSSFGGTGSGPSTGSAPSAASSGGFTFGTASAGASASSGPSSSGQQVGGTGASNNSFLSGAGISSGLSANHDSGSSPFSVYGPPAPLIFSGSALNSGFAQKLPQISSGSGNPFFQSHSHTKPTIFDLRKDVPLTGSSGEGQIHQEQSSGSEGLLRVTCKHEQSLCVPKHICSADGYIITEHLTRVRSGPQFCDVNTEVCCILKGYTPEEAPVEIPNGHSTITTSFGTGIDQAVQNNGGIFGIANNNHKQNDLLANKQESSVNTNQAKESNGYLPPIGSEPSSVVPSFSKPPRKEQPDEEGESSGSVPINVRPTFPPAPVPPPQVGCAAALICVEEQFCTLQGSISPVPVILSSEQLLRRAPLSSCKNPDNGVIGKCCRDLNYVDPWPAGNLPANYSGGFDEQGFPTFLNIAKTRPPKKQPINGSTKGGIPIKPNSPRPVIDSPREAPTYPQFPKNPNPIQNPPNQIPNNFPNTFDPPSKIPNDQVENFPAPFPQSPIESQPGSPSLPSQPSYPNRPNIQNQPGVPSLPSQPSQPSFPNRPNTQNQPSLPSFPIITSQPNFPAFPSISNPPSIKTPFPPKNNHVASSSNENLIVIQSHVPGRQCGLRNKVQRPNGLTDVDVAFGEIPWQAMVLWNTEKKLLCSGAIIAPNAIATAARCVEGVNSSDISIKTGEWKLGYELKHEEPLPFEIINVASIARHSEYSPDSPANDIAILILEHDIKMDQHVDVICLPQGQPQLPQPGRKCISTGWGKTVLQVHAAGALMHSIDVDVLSNEQCRQRLTGAESSIEIDDSLICTKAHRQNNNMCQVDLGGPLACDRGDGYYELIGVYNQDTGCLPTNQVATFATINTSWAQKILTYPSQVSVGESVLSTHSSQQHGVYNHGDKEACDCQKTNLPSQNNQYLPPQ